LGGTFGVLNQEDENFMKRVSGVAWVVMGWTMVCGPAEAQPPCSAIGMSRTDIALKKWWRDAPEPNDYTAWHMISSTNTFSSVGQILPIGPGQVYVIDNNRVIKLTLTNKGVLNGETPVASISGTGAMTTDGTNVFFIDSSGSVETQPVTLGTRTKIGVSGFVLDAIYDGDAVWVSMVDGKNNGYLARGVFTPKAGSTPPSMKFTVQNVGRMLKKLAFDGRYIWGAERGGNLFKFDGFTSVAKYPAGYFDDPVGLTFDGYAMWVSGGDNLKRFRASDGVALSSVPISGLISGMTFDGTNILGTDRTNGKLFVVRACDAAVLTPFAVPAGPLNVGFDGVNYWVSNNSTVSVR
jgi:hypothetical protein